MLSTGFVKVAHQVGPDAAPTNQPSRETSVRERVVQILTVGKFKLLECSCGYQRRWLLPCRHILFLNKWRLALGDIHRRYEIVSSGLDGGRRPLETPRFENLCVWPHLHLTDDELRSLPVDESTGRQEAKEDRITESDGIAFHVYDVTD